MNSPLNFRVTGALENSLAGLLHGTHILSSEGCAPLYTSCGIKPREKVTEYR